jgi:hypothetical protein
MGKAVSLLPSRTGAMAPVRVDTDGSPPTKLSTARRPSNRIRVVSAPVSTLSPGRFNAGRR